MVARLAEVLTFPISATRLEAYRPPGESDLDMVVNYLWNMELSEALYPCLQTFEIALRNSIHAAFSEHHATEFWFDRHDLLGWQRETLQEARDQLTTYQKPHEPGRIVAELPFGFWSSMFNSPYEQIWYADRAILLEKVFPHIPRTLRTRKKISQRVERIRRLRNRVFHYEPVWNKTDLQERHDQIHEALAWINVEIRDVMVLSDRFDSVFGGKQFIKAKLAKHVELTD